jgi:hypothetical protein
MQHIQTAVRDLDRRHYRKGESRTTEDDEREEIERLHASDGEIMFRLAELAARRGALGDAESLLDRSIECGYREAAAYLERASVRADAGNAVGASADALVTLGQSGVPPQFVMRAMGFVRGVESDMVAGLPAVTGLKVSEQLALAAYLARHERQEDIHRSTAILHRLADDVAQTEEFRARARSNLALNLIRSGRSRSAMEVLAHGGRRVEEMPVRDAFNYGMAAWAESNAVQPGPFERVVALDEVDDRKRDPNYLQCLAVANWAADNSERALEFARKAREAGADARLVFSCWRYRNVPGPVFANDVDEILAMIETNQRRMPRFARDPETRQADNQSSAVSAGHRQEHAAT